MLDDRDRRILGALAENARMTFRELGEVASLSANATAERVQRLVDDGVITRFSIEVSGAALGWGLQAHVDVRLNSDTTMAAFEKAIQHMDNVLEAVALTGTFDARLRVAAASPEALNRVIEELRAACGVRETCSAVICQRLELKAHGTRGMRLPLR